MKSAISARWSEQRVQPLAKDAFVYSSGAMSDLTVLTTSLPTVWALSDVNGINNLGGIICTPANSSGESEAFLLTPISSDTTGVAAGTSQHASVSGFLYGSETCFAEVMG